MEIEIGQSISEIRKEKKLTLKDVSVMSGVATSLISQIENNKANPSLSTLMALAKAFDVNVADFFIKEAPKAHGIVVRSSERPLIRQVVDGKLYLLNHELVNGMEFLYCTFDKGGSSSTELEVHSHGHEIGFVISGKLKVELGEEIYVLNTGDSITYDATRPHRITNMTDGQSIALWCVDSPEKF